jgi:hypothetical protein
MSRLERNDWLGLAAGVILGIAIGLLYAWLINPVEYVNTTPSSLRQSYQQDYLVLIAASYQQTGNLPRAEARLSLFDIADPAEQLAEMAQQRLAAEGSADSAQALARLASDLNVLPTGLAATRTPQMTSTVPATSVVVIATELPTARPSRTPTAAPTAGPPFELAERDTVCEPTISPPLLQVRVVDGAGEPVPGVEVHVLSDQGEDRFYTGLKPELGLGYGDFEMDPELSYNVQLPEAEGFITSIQSEPCILEDGESYPGSVLLVFEQPGS